MLSTTFNGWLLLLRGAVTYVVAVSCAGGVAEYVNNGGNPMQYAKSVILNVEEIDRLSFLPYLFGNDFLYAEASVYALAKKMMPEYEGGFWHFIRLPDGGGYMMPDGDRFHLVNGENWFDRTVSADAAGIIVTAPRLVGRGFPLLRPQPSVRRIYAGLHGQKRRVPPPSVPVFLFAGC